MSFLPESFKTMRLCRGCLSTDENNLQPLFGHGKEELFQRLTAIQISIDDGLPTLLCTNCMKILNEHNTFRLLCISSNVILQNRLKLIAREKSFMLEIESPLQHKLPKIARETVAATAVAADENAAPPPPMFKNKRHKSSVQKPKSEPLTSGIVNYVEFTPAVVPPSSNCIRTGGINDYVLPANNLNDNTINLMAEQSRTPKKINESPKKQSLSIGFNHITEEWQPCVLLRKISANIDL